MDRNEKIFSQKTNGSIIYIDLFISKFYAGNTLEMNNIERCEILCT